MVIAFFGHSNYVSSLDDEKQLVELLETATFGEQVDFYFGGYGNFDNFAYRCAKIYKKYHEDSKLIFITPYLNGWLDNKRDFLQKNYDEIIYPDIEQVPPKFAIIKRNEWIVNKSDYVFTYVKTHYGGAYRALLYAHKHKKPYINLYKGNYELY